MTSDGTILSEVGLSRIDQAHMKDLFDKRICDLRTDQYLQDERLVGLVTSVIEAHFADDVAKLEHQFNAWPLRWDTKQTNASRVLLTNHGLDGFAGSELWTADTAKFLQRAGAEVLVYSPTLGAVAAAMREAGVAITSSVPDAVNFRPDLVHVNHFATVRPLIDQLAGQAVVVNMIHGLLPRPGLPGETSVDRYCAVSVHAKAKTHMLTGTAWSEIHSVPNFFDPARFTVGDGTTRTGKALLFSSRTPPEHRERLRSLLAPAGISLEHIGYGGRPASAPELLLPQYELAFAVGRSAIEALACGCHVILWDNGILGPAVRAENFWQCVATNFSLAANMLPWVHISDQSAHALIADELARIRAGAGRAPTCPPATGLTRQYLSLDRIGPHLVAVYNEAMGAVQRRSGV